MPRSSSVPTTPSSAASLAALFLGLLLFPALAAALPLCGLVSACAPVAARNLLPPRAKPAAYSVVPIWGPDNDDFVEGNTNILSATPTTRTIVSTRTIHTPTILTTTLQTTTVVVTTIAALPTPTLTQSIVETTVAVPNDGSTTVTDIVTGATSVALSSLSTTTPPPPPPSSVVIITIIDTTSTATVIQGIKTVVVTIDPTSTPSPPISAIPSPSPTTLVPAPAQDGTGIPSV